MDTREEAIGRYINDKGGIAEDRDIEHANTPDEEIADVDVVTHGTSGGLNKSKRMYKPAGNRWGDNGMQLPINEEEGPTPQDYEIMRDPNFDIEAYDRYDLSPFMAQEIDNAVFHYSHGEGRGGWDDVWQSINQDWDIIEETTEAEHVSEDKSVETFLSLYKEFQGRGEKRS